MSNFEIREIRGQKLGYNTEKKFYFILPKNIADMTVDELVIYAKDKNIDIGQATSADGIIKKIKEHESKL